MTAAPRVFFVQRQSLFDRGSGAAVSMRGMARLLARHGCEVAALCTSGTETPDARPTVERLTEAGLDPVASDPAVLELRDGGVACAVVEDGRHDTWAAFDARLRDAIDRLDPGVVLTYGVEGREAIWRNRVRRAGARVVFALHNLAYVGRMPEEVDFLLAPSAFLAQHYRYEQYRRNLPVRVDHLPPPIVEQDVVPPAHTPVFFTFVNPAVEKGSAVVARIAEVLSRTRRDIPLLIVEARSGAGDFVRVCDRIPGFDVRACEQVMFSKGAASAAELMAATRVLLMPSVVEEAAGRLAAEALVNGIPVIASDRGGLPEILGDAGTVLSLAPSIVADPTGPPSPADVAGWIELIERLAGDDAFYASERARARARGEAFRESALGPRYLDLVSRYASVARPRPPLRTATPSFARPPLTMPEAEARWFVAHCLRARRILEYGCGGSTLLAADLSEAEIVSVESDPAWARTVSACVHECGAAGRVTVLHADIGPVGAWGHPVGEGTAERYRRYVEAPWNKGVEPDLVLIDGRFRVACLVLVALRARSPVTVLFDDYLTRPGYRVVETLLEPVETVGRMAKFEIEPGAAGDAHKAMYRGFLTQAD